VRQKGLCLRCLTAGHRIADCKSKGQCDVPNCADRDKHHTLLHKQIAPPKDNREGNQSYQSYVTRDSELCKPRLMTVPVRVCNGSFETETYALLDSGSEKTFCLKAIADQSQVNDQPATIEVTTLSLKNMPKTVEGWTMSFCVSAIEGSVEFDLNNVFAVDNLPVQSCMPPTMQDLANLKEMWDIYFPEIKDKAVSLLIGVDHCKLLTPLESRFGPEGGPDALRTSLG